MEVNVTGVYRITSPSGKEYIGSSNNIKRRWWQHKNATKKGVETLLCRSMRKYREKKKGVYYGG